MPFQAVNEARSQMGVLCLPPLISTNLARVPEHEHVDILGAIKDHDPERARQTMQSNDKVLSVASLLPARRTAR